MMFHYFINIISILIIIIYFFFNDTATTEIYTLSLHDALPIYRYEKETGRALINDGEFNLRRSGKYPWMCCTIDRTIAYGENPGILSIKNVAGRSEEHTSELQSQSNLVCRLLLEKKKKKTKEKT